MALRTSRRQLRVVRGRFGRRRPRSPHRHAFQHWREPLCTSDPARLDALGRAIAPVELMAEPLWRRAASGDAAAAVAIAIDRVWTREVKGLRRDLILTALWRCASAGDPASVLVLASLRERIDVRERS